MKNINNKNPVKEKCLWENAGCLLEESDFTQKKVKKIAAANAAKFQRSSAEVQTLRASYFQTNQKAIICAVKIKPNEERLKFLIESNLIFLSTAGNSCI